MESSVGVSSANESATAAEEEEDTLNLIEVRMIGEGNEEGFKGFTAIIEYEFESTLKQFLLLGENLCLGDVKVEGLKAQLTVACIANNDIFVKFGKKVRYELEEVSFF